MTLDPEKAKEYSELLSRFQFVFDDKWAPECQETVAAAVKLVRQDERVLLATRGHGTLNRISLNPAAAMDLALRLSHLIREAGWYGDDPAAAFMAIQQAADTELQKAKAEDLGQEPLGMNDPKVLHSFKRNPNGTWTCIRAVKITGPSGEVRIGPGQTFSRNLSFMGMNVHEHLEWMSTRPEKPQ